MKKEEAKKIATYIEKLLINKPYGIGKSIKKYAEEKVKAPGKVFAIYPRNDAEKNFTFKVIKVISIQHYIKKKLLTTQEKNKIEKINKILKKIYQTNKLLTEIEEDIKKINE